VSSRIELRLSHQTTPDTILLVWQLPLVGTGVSRPQLADHQLPGLSPRLDWSRLSLLAQVITERLLGVHDHQAEPAVSTSREWTGPMFLVAPPDHRLQVVVPWTTARRVLEQR
jgi:hypothetical protein